jgi:membrane fusion protein (multidrug efflux system)
MGRTRRWVIVGAIILIVAAVGTGFALKNFRSKESAAADQDPAAGSEEQVALEGDTKSAEGSEDDKDAKKDRKGRKGDKEEKAPVPVSIAAVASGSISSYITSTANLVAENEVRILAETEGRVDDLNVEEGDRIGRGQVLASIDRSDEEITLKKAEVRAANARIVYDRAKQVVADNLMSQEQFDKVRMESEIAAQELAEARWKLDKTAIKAPFGGRVTERAIKPGQHVRPGDHLFTVADFDPLIARIYLPEKDVFGLREGRQIRISLKAHDEVRFAGRIRQISPVVDTGTGTVKVTVEATAPPAEVRPGAFVTIDIVRETRARATLVPREAVVRELQEAYVFVARDGAAVRLPIALGLEENGHIEAVSGIEPGEEVIVAGQGNLKDGARVTVIASPAAREPNPRPDPPRRG